MLSVQIHFAQYSIYYPSDYSLTCHIRLPRNVFLHVYNTYKKFKEMAISVFQCRLVSSVPDPQKSGHIPSRVLI